MTGLFVGFAIAFIAGMTQGCTGFGLALVAAPCMMLVLDPRIVVPSVVLLSTVNTALVAYDARRHIRLWLVVPLALGGIVGFPFGAHALTALNASTIKVFVGIFVILFATALLAGWRKPLPMKTPFLLPVGVAGGFLGGCTSMGGPPVILFLSNQDLPKDAFRGN
ncbi:MAG: uncharacterized protein QG656_1128, partial [Candidatus Hydrogenedentes bacterium]|nr:uncharacterized protein [Candidatus Hydrogenedentota bacterium]